MNLSVCYSCLCLSILASLSAPQNVRDHEVKLFNDISKILTQLRGKSSEDQLKVFNFIRSNVNLINNNARQRSNNRFSSDLHPWKSFRSNSKKTNRRVDPVKSEVGIGTSCSNGTHCPTTRGLECKESACKCIDNYIQVNGTHCLRGALLGFRCEHHSQCQTRVASSSCIQSFCRCGEGFVPYRRANCLKGVLLDQKCRTHAQCMIRTPGSTCKWLVRNVMGKCQCDARNPRRGNKCGPSGFALGAPCGRSYDCAQHVPGSICAGKSEAKNKQNVEKERRRGGSTKPFSHYDNVKFPDSTLSGVCQCPKGYLDIKNGSRCVPVSKEAGVSPVSLGQQCLYSSQCKSADPFTTCNNGICTCMVESAKCSVENRGCFNNTFQCITDGRCISAEFVCNGFRDCSDGSDELQCVPGRCSPLAFTCDDGSCVTRGRVCDGKPHCPDGSDERSCVGHKTCPKSAFRCKNGQCLTGTSFCNARLDCRDGSDEDKMTCIGGKLRVKHCPFRCKNSRCRSSGIVCSGQDGCGDNSDEEKCSVCSCPKP